MKQNHPTLPLALLADWPVSDIDRVLWEWWQQLPTPKPAKLGVAFSAGADSTALLLAALRLQHGCYRPDRRVALPQQIVALHVHHGLQSAADAFAQHCKLFCSQLPLVASTDASASARATAKAAIAAEGSTDSATELELPTLQDNETQAVTCVISRVQIALAAGDSLEAQARIARYQALASSAQQTGAEIVLLAHHADDQAETVLLALSRGAGVAGLAGMPAQFNRNGCQFARPLLAISGAWLRQWLHQHQVSWIEDPSNTDQRFTRNRFRHSLLPALEQAMPAFRTSIARSARMAAQADQLLQALAKQDMEQTGNPPRIRALQQFDRARQANLLRYWLKTSYQTTGSEAQISALLDVLAACTTRGHKIRIKTGNGYVERDGEKLVWGLLQ